MEKRICIIGAGNIGSRHLQALALSKYKLNIFIVDCLESSLEKAKRIFEETNGCENHKVQYLYSINQIPEIIDIAIIATSADVRKNVIVHLTSHAEVKYMILEKVLFQKLDEYDYFNSLLESKNISAWVNCPRRLYPGYINLKEKLIEANSINVMVSGNQWGLACNCIHMLDLIGFLAGDEGLKIDLDNLDDSIIQSHREGFYEITGSIIGEMGKCKNFIISSYNAEKCPITITICSDIMKCVINENKKRIYASSKETNWEWTEDTFEVMYQSQLTHLVVQDILENGKCELINYKNSMYLHTVFIETLSSFFEKKGLGKNICPIT